MKKMMFLSLAVILESMYSDVEAMGAALVGTAKVVAGELANTLSTVDVSRVDLNLLANIPEVMENISANEEVLICEGAAERECTGNWAGQSIEGLLSRVSNNNPTQASDLLEAYAANTVGRTFSRERIWGYYLQNPDNENELLSLLDSLENVLPVISNFSFQDGRIVDTGNIAPHILATANTSNTNKIDITIGTKTGTATVAVTGDSRDAEVNAINGVRANIAQVIANVLIAGGDGSATNAVSVLTNAGISAADAGVINAVIATQTAAARAATNDPIHGVNANPVVVSNVNRLHLAGAMHVIANGLGIPDTDVHASAASGANPLIAATTVANRVSPWVDDPATITEEQQRSAAQSLLKIAESYN